MNADKICPNCGATYGADHVFCPIDSAPLRRAGAGDELLGSVIANRYLISERIGAGGMGEVYKAQDVRLQRPAAVKVLRAQLADDLDSLARFSREAANASKINNEHVVQIYDYGETGEGRPFLAMEFIAGESLRAVLDREQRLEPRRVSELTRQIAAGLDKAHGLDIVHRDLKPDNVLVCRDETRAEIAKVVDFGISKALRDASQRVTKTGFVTGTYEFMSPEQVTGGTLDLRTDVYSLGLMVFRMLTGVMPFPGETAEHSMLLRLHEPPHTLRDGLPSIAWPEELEAVVAGALARDPAERYRSAGAFARALAGAIEHWQQPVVNTETAPLLQVPWPRWRIWPAGAMAGAALVVGLAIGLWPSPTEETGITDPIPPTSTSIAEKDTTTAPPPDSGIVTGSGEDTAENRDTERRQTRAYVRTDTASGRASGSSSRERSSPEAIAELDRYGKVLMQKGLPADSARGVLLSLDALLPSLKTKSDSVQAQIHRAEAYGLLEEWDNMCATIEAARPYVTPTQRRRIQLWVGLGLCKAPEWKSS